MIGDNMKWKKHSFSSTDPEYFLTTKAPENVDVWQFQAFTIFDDVQVRSKPVSDTSELKHCPTDYPENNWEYLDGFAQGNPWKQANVKIICAWEVTSM